MYQRRLIHAFCAILLLVGYPIGQAVAGPATPSVISSVRADANPANAASVDFIVTFSEPVTGVDISDFILTTAGVTGAFITGVSTVGATRTVTVNTGTGNGTIRLDVKDDDSIVNQTAIPLGGVGVGNGAFTGGETYSVDKTAPTVVSSLRANPSPTGAASVTFSVTFAEAVIGVDAADFSLMTTGSISGASITSVSGAGTTYTVTVNTGSGAGTIRLNVVDDDSILDVAFQRLGGVGVGNGAFTSGEAYVVRMHRIHVPLVM